jgi:hypothetical protein
LHVRVQKQGEVNICDLESVIAGVITIAITIIIIIIIIGVLEFLRKNFSK